MEQEILEPPVNQSIETQDIENLVRQYPAREEATNVPVHPEEEPLVLRAQ